MFMLLCMPGTTSPTALQYCANDTPWHQVLTVIVWIMLVRYGKSNVLMLLYHALPNHPVFTLQGIVSYHILKSQSSYWYTRVKIRTTVLTVSFVPTSHATLPTLSLWPVDWPRTGAQYGYVQCSFWQLNNVIFILLLLFAIIVNATP